MKFTFFVLGVNAFTADPGSNPVHCSWMPLQNHSKIDINPLLNQIQIFIFQQKVEKIENEFNLESIIQFKIWTLNE